MDLRTRMDLFGGPIEQPSDDIIAGVITQGRAARQRRRRVQVAAGSVFGAAAVVAAFSLAAGPLSALHQQPPAIAGPATTSATGGVTLVAYTGEQPHLFTIDTVPQGFFIQAQNEYELVLAPQRAKRPGPGDDPSADLFDPRVYTDKIAVYLQNKDYMVDPVGDEQLTIAGKAAAIRTAPTENGRPGATQVFVVQGPRVYLTVQFDASLGLTRDQMIEVAGGISLTPAAVAEAEQAYAKPAPSKIK